jgi:hypothetical protein
MPKSLLYKILSISCLILLITGILIAWNSAAKGFETSIYSSAPKIFWIAVLLCTLTGITGVLQHLYREHGEEDSHYPILPLLLVFLSFAAILSIFIIRGYALWASGDPLTHLGWIQNIIRTGAVDNFNYYPVTHVYLTQIFEVTRIPVITLSKIMPLFFEILSVGFTYCLAKSVLPRKGEVILATVLSMALLNGWFLDLTPNILANFFIPFCLYILIKSLTSTEFRWKLLLALVILILPMFHIVPAVVFLLILIGIPVARWILVRTNARETSEIPHLVRFCNVAAICLFIWEVVWISSFGISRRELSNLYQLVTGGLENQLSSLVNQINYGAGYNYSVASIFFKTYGGLLVLIILTLLAVGLLWRKGYFSDDYRILAFFTVPLGFVALAVAGLYLVNLDFPPLRLLVYIEMICTLFAAVILYRFFTIQNGWLKLALNRVGVPVIAMILTGLFVAGGMVVYPSRYSLEISAHITQSEINGMDWFLHYNNTHTNHTYLAEIVYRFADLLLTPEEKSTRTDVMYSWGRHEEMRVPFHLGYDKSDLLGNYYQNDLYLVLKQLDKVIYREVYPEIASIRFEPQDFEKLETDPSIQSIYTNGGLDIYYVRGLLQPP